VEDIEMAVHWVPYLSIALKAVTPQDLAELEREWGVSLSEEYKALVTAYQGMTPEPGVFDVGRGTNVFNVLLTVKRHEGREAYSVGGVHDALKPLVPRGVFPFAGTPTGEYICFDYRSRPSSPQIVFVTVEAFIYQVAEGLTDFLNKLHN
jgi:cell wall assembly regulator SMI1